jgi:galactose mutarotase-like enzyme
MTVAVRAEESRYRGEPAIALEAGRVAAVFLPTVGMTGVSLRFRGRERLSVPGGVPRIRAGGTAGLPLLAPWANRLAARRYRVGRVAVDLARLRLRTDDNGLPIHGLLVGSPDWRVERVAVRGTTARLLASVDVDARAFPFPHRIEVLAVVGDDGLAVETTVTPTARRRVPVAFGWHPYLRLAGVPRRRWSLRLPARDHLLLDQRGIPTGASVAEPAEIAPIGSRTFDDLFAVGRDLVLALDADDGQSIELRSDAGYPFAQVWVPKGRAYAALEPMAAPTNSLLSGSAPIVAPGESYSARFTLTGN